MLFTILLSLFILVSLLMILVILLQQGKGGMGSVFGGGSGSVLGTGGGANLLTRLTTIFAFVFMLLAFGLARVSMEKPRSEAPDEVEVAPEDQIIPLQGTVPGATQAPTASPSEAAAAPTEAPAVAPTTAPTTAPAAEAPAAPPAEAPATE